MNISTAATIILSVVLLAELALLTGQSRGEEPSLSIPVNPLRQTQTSSPTPTTIPEPVPDFKTELWGFDGRCVYHGIAGSCTPQKYIIPNNEVVRWYANRVTLTDGELMWNLSNNALRLDGIVGFNYISDKEQFGEDDLWQNPDYFLTHGMVGDCEDGALVVASLLEEKGIRAIIVGGYLTEDNNRKLDWIVEYKYKGVYYRYFGGIYNSIFIQREKFERQKGATGMDFDPISAFDRNSFYYEYREDW